MYDFFFLNVFFQINRLPIFIVCFLHSLMIDRDSTVFLTCNEVVVIFNLMWNTSYPEFLIVLLRPSTKIPSCFYILSNSSFTTTLRSDIMYYGILTAFLNKKPWKKTTCTWGEKSTRTHTHTQRPMHYAQLQKKRVSKTYFSPFHYLTFQQLVIDSCDTKVQQKHVS
jgi:hypothetical protein